jgi:hypothetical protein
LLSQADIIIPIFRDVGGYTKNLNNSSKVAKSESGKNQVPNS